MNAFFPFIYEKKKKKNIEYEPLYIELVPPPPEEEPKKEDYRIIIEF